MKQTRNNGSLKQRKEVFVSRYSIFNANAMWHVKNPNVPGAVISSHRTSREAWAAVDELDKLDGFRK